MEDWSNPYSQVLPIMLVLVSLIGWTFLSAVSGDELLCQKHLIQAYDGIRPEVKASSYEGQLFIDENLAHVNGSSVPGKWISGKNDVDQYVQVDLGAKTVVKGVVTQGQGYNWVTRYRVLHSLDEQHWHAVGDFVVTDKFFVGNSDAITPKTNYFDCQIEARYLRINPIEWKGGISMGFDFLGCEESKKKLTETSKPKCGQHCQSNFLSGLRTTINLTPELTTAPRPVMTSTESRSKLSKGDRTGKDCIGSRGSGCIGKRNGDYQHCFHCRKFVKCSNQYYHEFDCPANLVWDDSVKRCEYVSGTC